MGRPFAVGVSSGTDALEACLRAVGVRPSDEVVLPALSFYATVEAVLRVGAVPRFVDLSGRGPHPEPAAFLAAVGPRTRAMIAAHLFGGCVPLRPLVQQLAERDPPVPLIEDAAQALGASITVDGERWRAGAQGTVAATSFFPAKPLGAWGDGGCVLTDSADLAIKVRRLRQHSQLAPG